MAVRVKESFSFDIRPGEPTIMKRGTLLPDDHPYVKGREHLFEPADDAAARSDTRRSVETATAAPGERRNVSVSRKPASEKG